MKREELELQAAERTLRQAGLMRHSLSDLNGYVMRNGWSWQAESTSEGLYVGVTDRVKGSLDPETALIGKATVQHVNISMALTVALAQAIRAEGVV